MILLWGLSGDNPLEGVMNSLRDEDTPFVLLDQRDILSTEVELDFGATLDGVVRTPSAVIDLGEITATYMRVYDSRNLPDVKQAGCGSASWSHALAVESALYSWVECTETLVVNKPSAMASNNSKPFQGAVIRQHDFALPATLITTTPVAAEEFWQEHDAVIYKSISGVRSIVSRVSDAHRKRLADIAWCPTQFQQYIQGNDYRVHVVGERIFACEILSEADDYRYANRQGASVDVRAVELPPEVCERVCALVADLRLSIAGVDLRLTPEGVWYCFEVNPSPGFTFYESETAQPIAEAIAQLLSRASLRDRALMRLACV
ncbi:MAG TPA: ATP-grasp domain-containing protein [Pyrinomonadaceae bacterium]|jgi:glutathione synthase/RimK-type ligase-like ATP-grasp enzyme